MAGNLILIGRLAGEFKLLSNPVLKSSEILVTLSVLKFASNLETFGYREATSRTTTELVESPFMATSLRMRTSPWSTPVLAACPWPMLAPTPTVHSSSSAQILLHGEQKRCECACLLDPCCGAPLPDDFSRFLKTHFYSLAFNSVWELWLFFLSLPFCFSNP